MCKEPVTDEELIEKTLSTIPPSQISLARQYRAMKFKTYADLAAYLLTEEENDNLLLKNSHRPIGAKPLPESHSVQVSNHPNVMRWSKAPNRKGNFKSGVKPVYRRIEKRNNTQITKKGNKTHETRKCYKCSTVGHMAAVCATSAHLVNLYQVSREKENNLSDVPKNKQSDASIVYSAEIVDDTFGDADVMEIYYTDMDISSEVNDISNKLQVFILCEPSCVEGVLIDSGTKYNILKDRTLFVGPLKPFSATTLTTIMGTQPLSAFIGSAELKLDSGIIIKISEAIYLPNATRNLVSLKDLHLAGYIVQSMYVDDTHILQLCNKNSEIKLTLTAYSSGLFFLKTYSIQSYSTIYDKNKMLLWHERFGHPGISMMRRIIMSTCGHNIINSDLSEQPKCESCALGKFITRPSTNKLQYESLQFLDRLQGDICGPINPPCGPFRYYLILIDASSKWSSVALLASRNQAFAKLLGMLFRLRNQFPDSPIKKLRLDGAGEFTSKSFNEYCESTGIELEHSVPHVHTQNGLAESFIKRLRLIAVPMLMKSNLSTSAWGHAILHAAKLVQVRPSGGNELSPYELATGLVPNIKHLRVFGCKVLVPIPPPHRTKMGPQRKEGIYVGYITPSIIRYIEPNTGNLFNARYADCYFDESIFPKIYDYDKEKEISLSFDDTDTLKKWPDPYTSECENTVYKMLYMKRIAEEQPDSFNNSDRITKSHIVARNVPALTPLDIPAKLLGEESSKRKRGPDIKPRKRRTKTELSHTKGDEIINYFVSNKINLSDNQNLSTFYSNDDFDTDPVSILEAMKRTDWPMWQKAINEELKALNHRNVFGIIQNIPQGVKPIGYRWVFVRKRDSDNQVLRYKARLVAQGFSQRPGIDFDETYSPVIDSITFRYLISLSVSYQLDMRLLDVVTAYLYGTLERDIYMKVPLGLCDKGITTLQNNNKCIKLQKALYGLKQSGRVWYQRLHDFFIKHSFTTDKICPCIFIRQTLNGPVIVAVYVDDLNIIGPSKAIEIIASELKTEFEMKDLGITTYCLGREVEHTKIGVFLHQSSYIKKILVRFRMDNAYPLSSPMIIRTLETSNDPFRPREQGEDELDPNVPYQAAIGALMYLANHTRPDIAFSVNLLARFSANPTKRHWNGIKHLLRYLRSTIDLGLLYRKDSNPEIIGYVDASYLSDPHNRKSQTGYVFLSQGAAISWKSTKQTLVATSPNHSEIIALYEATRECVWLRSVNKFISSKSKLSKGIDKPTTLYEDNETCISQIKSGYIPGQGTRHIIPKYFYTHELLGIEIDLRYIKSCENLADMFTKSLPSSVHREMTRKIGMRRLSELL